MNKESLTSTETECRGVQCHSRSGAGHSVACMNEMAAAQGWTPSAPEYATCDPDAGTPTEFSYEAAATNFLVHLCHSTMVKIGWWKNPKTGKDPRDNVLCFSNKLALIHSEISESLEGDRKDLMDPHLPHRKNREVELADALIRICDLAGAYGMDLGGAVKEKLAYNVVRADHKLENREASGGKTY